MPLEAWLSSDASPRDFYELIGVKRFEPDREALLRCLRDVVRRLMQYERHQDPAIAGRATRLQREAALADRALRDRDRFQQAHTLLLQTIANEWAQRTDEAGVDLSAWLEDQGVHPDRVWLVRRAIVDGDFETAATFDWPEETASTVDVIVPDDGPEESVPSGDPSLPAPLYHLPPSVGHPGHGNVLPQASAASWAPLPTAIPVAYPHGAAVPILPEPTSLLMPNYALPVAPAMAAAVIGAAGRAPGSSWQKPTLYGGIAMLIVATAAGGAYLARRPGGDAIVAVSEITGAAPSRAKPKQQSSDAVPPAVAPAAARSSASTVRGAIPISRPSATSLPPRAHTAVAPVATSTAIRVVPAAAPSVTVATGTSRAPAITPPSQGTATSAARAVAAATASAPSVAQGDMSRPPDLSRLFKLYECDFDVEVPEFRPTTGSVICETRNGSLHLQRDPDDVGRKGTMRGNLAAFPVSDFACEMTFRWAGDVDCEMGISMDRFKSRSVVNPGRNHCLVVNQRKSLAPDALRNAEWNSLLTVVQNRRMTTYLNGVHMAGPVDLDVETSLPGRIALCIMGPEGAAFEVDKFTMWDLAGVTLAAAAPLQPAPPFVPDYDSVDLPPLSVAGQPVDLLTGYCKPEAAAQIELKLEMIADVGSSGPNYRLEPDLAAASERTWNIVATQRTKLNRIVAKLRLCDGILGFQWLSAEPTDENLRNAVLLAFPNSSARPLIFRGLVRVPAIAIDTVKGTGDVALANAVGLTRLDGVRWQVLGLSEFPAGVEFSDQPLRGSEKLLIGHHPGQIDLEWSVVLLRSGGALRAAHTMRVIDGKRIKTLTAPLIRRESEAIAQNEAAAKLRLEQLLISKLVIDIQAGLVSNAVVIEHNRRVAELQAEIDLLAQRQAIFSKVVNAIEKMQGRAAIRLRVFVVSGGREFDLVRAE